MAKPIVYGPAYSTYLRTVRLALEEKGCDYELADISTPATDKEDKKAMHKKRHPFIKVPAFEHDGFELYETDAIIRYIDQVLPGPKLVPADPKAQARMNQIIGIVDSYANDCMIGKIAVERVFKPKRGGQTDEAVVAAAIPRAKTCLAEIERLAGGGQFLVGDSVTLADCLFAPILNYLLLTPEGPGLLEPHAGLKGWWERMKARPSMAKTG